MLSMEWAYINVKKANKSHYLKACGANKDFRNQDWVNKKKSHDFSDNILYDYLDNYSVFSEIFTISYSENFPMIFWNFWTFFFF